MRPFQFINGPWENSELPTIVKDDPAGGDPHILAVIKRVHNPDALYDLCRIANDQVEVATETGLTPRQLAERCKELRTLLGNLLNCVDGQHDYDWLDRCKSAARAAIAKNGGVA